MDLGLLDFLQWLLPAIVYVSVTAIIGCSYVQRFDFNP